MQRNALLAAVLVLTLGGSTVAPTSATAGDDPDRADSSARRYLRSDLLMVGALSVGALHHVDHVLRDNHSGWPFTQNVNEFTASLAVYPIYGTAYALDAGPASYIVIDSVATVGLGLAHTLVEPPHDQYDPWADGTNVTGNESPALGRVSQGLSFALSAAVAGHLVSSIVDGTEHGFTWRRRSDDGDESASLRVAPSPNDGGAGLSISGTF